MIVRGLSCQLVGYPAVWLTEGLPSWLPGYLASPQDTFTEHMSVIETKVSSPRHNKCLPLYGNGGAQCHALLFHCPLTAIYSYEQT
jgi:hypothetical protein